MILSCCSVLVLLLAQMPVWLILEKNLTACLDLTLLLSVLRAQLFQWVVLGKRSVDTGCGGSPTCVSASVL